MNIRKITIYTVSVPLLLTDSTFGFVLVSVGKNTVRIKTRNIQYYSTYYSTASSISSYKRHTCFPIANSSSSRDNDKDALDSQPATHHQQEEQEDVGVLENYEFVPIQDGEISDDLIREKLEGAPSELEIFKELLGINAFTYVLACLIAFFLGMNLLLGPGWLGQLAGLEGRGTFTEISDSLPDSVDLSRPEFLLDE